MLHKQELLEGDLVAQLLQSLFNLSKIHILELDMAKILGKPQLTLEVNLMSKIFQLKNSQADFLSNVTSYGWIPHA